MIKKLSARLHLWLGLPIGVVVVLMCLSGFLLVWEEDVRQLIHPEHYQISLPPASAGAEPLPLDSLLGRVAQSHGELRLSSIRIPSDPEGVITLQVRGGRLLYVDPYTARVQAEAHVKDQDLFTWLRGLHRQLQDSSRTWGSAIVQYSTLGFVLILLSGIVLWWPKGKKQLEHRLKIKTDASRQRLYSDLHISLGFYLSLGLLLLALTGLTWSFPSFGSALSSVVGTGEGNGRGSGQTLRTPARKVMPEPEVLQGLLTELRHRYAGEEHTIELTPSQTNVYTHPLLGTPEEHDRYLYNKDTGVIEEAQPWSTAPRSQKFRAWVKALHYGTWLGYASKVLTALVTLLGATLPLTGYYLYIKKRPKKRKPATL